MLLTTIYKADKKYPDLIVTLAEYKVMTETLINAVRIHFIPAQLAIARTQSSPLIWSLKLEQGGAHFSGLL